MFVFDNIPEITCKKIKRHFETVVGAATLNRKVITVIVTIKVENATFGYACTA